MEADFIHLDAWLFVLLNAFLHTVLAVEWVARCSLSKWAAVWKKKLVTSEMGRVGVFPSV